MQQPPSEQWQSESQDNSDSERGQTAIEFCWAIYGGWRGLIKQPFLWLAVVLTIVCAPFWLSVKNEERVWAQTAIDIVPGMLGFSLGGMAILLALSDQNLLKAVRKEGKPDSLFMKTVSSFFYFIFLQTTAIFMAFIAKS